MPSARTATTATVRSRMRGRWLARAMSHAETAASPIAAPRASTPKVTAIATRRHGVRRSVSMRRSEARSVRTDPSNDSTCTGGLGEAGLVGDIDHCGSVRDDEHSLARHGRSLEGGGHDLLTRGIKMRGGFVKDEERCIEDEGPRERETLALDDGEPNYALADLPLQLHLA